MEPDVPLIAVQRARSPRLADVVSGQLRDLILSGELADGERLPPIDRLVAQFEVSAPTLREALRILEAEGLITVRRGVTGPTVRHPTSRSIAYTIALVLRSQDIRKRDVADAIAMLEPLCASACARRLDRLESVVPTLNEHNEVSSTLIDGDPTQFNDRMQEFHKALVELSGNHTLTVLTRALEDLWTIDLQQWLDGRSGDYPSPDHRRAEVDVHRRITDLIAAGDDMAVYEASAQHFQDRMIRLVTDTDENIDPSTVRPGT